MTPTAEQLAAVRQAAEMCVALVGRQPITDYVLATIPERPGDPITAEWLRQCWGFDHLDGWLRYADYERDVYFDVHQMRNGELLLREPHRAVKTRHQFAKLMAALGIEPKGEGA